MDLKLLKNKLNKLINKDFPDLELIIMPKKHLCSECKFTRQNIKDINVYLNSNKCNFNLIPYKSDRIKILRLNKHEIG